MATASISELSARAHGLPGLGRLQELKDGQSSTAVYLVGGAVRDLLCGAELVDIDLATTGDPAELAALLGATAPPATRFGTTTVHIDGVRYDIALTRREHYPQPGALPAVEPAEIEADLRRRDFTVNAIAFGLTGPRAGEIVAAPNALDDLNDRRLAVLHERSFLDDPTRLLRLARYAARLGFEVAPETRELARQAVAGDALETISGTRIGHELRLLAAEPDPVSALRAAADLGLPWQIDADLAARALAALPPDGRPDIVILALALAQAVAPPSSQDGPPRAGGPLRQELDDLGFSATDRDAIAEAATQAPVLADRLRKTRSRSEIDRAVGRAGAATVALASALGPPEPAQRWLTELRHRQLDITGADLIESGVAEGPAIGRGLTAARAAMLDGQAPDREAQLTVALQAAR